MPSIMLGGKRGILLIFPVLLAYMSSSCMDPGLVSNAHLPPPPPPGTADPAWVFPCGLPVCGIGSGPSCTNATFLMHVPPIPTSPYAAPSGAPLRNAAKAAHNTRVADALTARCMCNALHLRNALATVVGNPNEIQVNSDKIHTNSPDSCSGPPYLIAGFCHFRFWASFGRDGFLGRTFAEYCVLEGKRQEGWQTICVPFANGA